MMNFITMPMCVLDILHAAWTPYDTHDDLTHDEEIHRMLDFQVPYSRIVSFEESREIAKDILGVDPKFLKEGHTSSVWCSEGLPTVVVNIARDRDAAVIDLFSSFRHLQQAWKESEERTAQVTDIWSMEGVGYVVVKHVPEAVELTMDYPIAGGPDAKPTFSVITKFIGLDKPEATMLDEKASERVLKEIVAIENDLNLSLTVLHGDCVLDSKMRVVAVGCDDPGILHFTPFRHPNPVRDNRGSRWLVKEKTASPCAAGEAVNEFTPDD